MFVIEQNGKSLVLSGWRAWLAGAAILVVAWLVCALVGFVILGLAATLGVLMLLLVPALLVVVLVSWVTHGQR
jgi:hypothetical protein